MAWSARQWLRAIHCIRKMTSRTSSVPVDGMTIAFERSSLGPWHHPYYPIFLVRECLKKQNKTMHRITSSIAQRTQVPVTQHPEPRRAPARTRRQVHGRAPQQARIGRAVPCRADFALRANAECRTGTGARHQGRPDARAAAPGARGDCAHARRALVDRQGQTAPGLPERGRLRVDCAPAPRAHAPEARCGVGVVRQHALRHHDALAAEREAHAHVRAAQMFYFKSSGAVLAPFAPVFLFFFVFVFFICSFFFAPCFVVSFPSPPTALSFHAVT